MAKRDRDTNIWKDPFYRTLPPLYKCLWDYMNDDCDNAGVWICDFKVASMVIGKKIDPEMAAKIFAPKIQISDDGHKWWITTFIPEKLGFEIDILNPSHKFQKSIIDLLNKHKIKNFKVFADTLQSVKEREEKEKDKDMGKEREEKGVQGEKQNPIEIGTPNGHRVVIQAKYVGDVPIVIHGAEGLKKHFTNTGQLDAIERAKWIDFDGFMEANPARFFDDADYLYNSFKKHHEKKTNDFRSSKSRASATITPERDYSEPI